MEFAEDAITTARANEQKSDAEAAADAAQMYKWFGTLGGKIRKLEEVSDVITYTMDCEEDYLESELIVNSLFGRCIGEERLAELNLKITAPYVKLDDIERRLVEFDEITKCTFTLIVTGMKKEEEEDAE